MRNDIPRPVDRRLPSRRWTAIYIDIVEPETNDVLARLVDDERAVPEQFYDSLLARVEDYHRRIDRQQDEARRSDKEARQRAEVARLLT